MTRLRASIILVAFAFVLIAAPLVASNGMCKMSCCKHGKSTVMQVPMCPLPQQCPQVSRDLDDSTTNSATPAPSQPVVHAMQVVVAVIASSSPPRRAETDDVRLASSTSERPLYLFDSVFLI
jgi:hypothetical protein